MAQAVIRRSLTTEARVPAWVNPCGVCGGKYGIGTVFSPRVFFFLVNIISAVTLHSHISLGEE
jgi:hypothetical protein